jgi:hypothetical protein
LITFLAQFLPDIHRELKQITVNGDVVSIELSIQGTFLGPFETPAGVIQPTAAKLDIPTADFWYVRDGKIQEFNCHIGLTTFFAQLGRAAGLCVRSRGARGWRPLRRVNVLRSSNSQNHRHQVAAAHPDGQ